MSLYAKAGLLTSAISLIVVMASRFILGGWINILYIPFALFFLGLIAALIIDRRLFFDFLTMRTTKGGLSMGTMIVLMLGLLFAVNYLGIRYNKTWDVTEASLNSLSKQTTKLLEGLEEDLNIYLFYRGGDAMNAKKNLEFQLTVYEQFSPRVKIRSINTYLDNKLAQDFLNDLPDKRDQDVFLFIEYKGKRARVNSPFKEKEFVAGLVQVTRTSEKSLYFLTGHGERDINSDTADGMSQFKEALEAASYKVQQFNLIEGGEIPSDADVVAIVGPLKQLLEPELEKLRAFARSGGHFFIAADPGQKHNLPLLTKTLGVEFKNNFVFNQESLYVGKGAASAIGVLFDSQDEITSSFTSKQNFTIFDLASEVERAHGAPETLESVELVKTLETSFSLTELKEPKEEVEGRVHTIAIRVSGQLEPKPDQKPEDVSANFSAVIVGDSDFLSNQAIFQGLNRDLALNSIAYLTQESDLISVQPKIPKGTQVIMTRLQMATVIIGGIALPLILYISSAVIWFRRRSA